MKNKTVKIHGSGELINIISIKIRDGMLMYDVDKDAKTLLDFITNNIPAKTYIRLLELLKLESE